MNTVRLQSRVNTQFKSNLKLPTFKPSLSLPVSRQQIFEQILFLKIRKRMKINNHK